MKPSDRVFVALDTTDTAEACMLAEKLQGRVGGIKLGKEFFTANGPQGVREVSALGAPVFLDLKFHDIPNTVAGAVRAALPLNPFMLNLHASGGAAMIAAAAKAADEGEGSRPMMLAVTVLTSLGDGDVNAMGVTGTAREQVVRLAKMAQANGMDGVVCSAHEVMTLRGACGKNFKLIVPGIRPSWSSTDDQKRVVTPAEAVAMGADYLVIGRPITKAADPIEAVERITEELDAG